MKANAHVGAVARQWTGKVVHLLRGNLGVRNDDGVAVGGAKNRRAPADFGNTTFALPDLDPVAHAQRAVDVQQNAGQDVGQRALQRQAEDGREHRRRGDERPHVHAALPEHARDDDHEAEHQHEVAQKQREADGCPAGQNLEDAQHGSADHAHGDEERRQHGQHATGRRGLDAQGEQGQAQERQQRADGQEDLQHAAVVAIFCRKQSAQKNQNDERAKSSDQAHASPSERAGCGEINEALAEVHRAAGTLARPRAGGWGDYGVKMAVPRFAGAEELTVKLVSAVPGASSWLEASSKNACH